MNIRITALDRMFSVYIRRRANWTCECCYKGFREGDGRLQCSHFHGRRKKSVRWDPDNCVALCFHCHQRFTENPMTHVSWMQRHLGEVRFQSLQVRANNIGMPDQKLIMLWLREEEKRHARDKE